MDRPKTHLTVIVVSLAGSVTIAWVLFIAKLIIGVL
jgi:hypothetical protein